MRCVLAPSVVVLVVLLAACGKQPADNLADALAADPVRLKALRAQCLQPHGIGGQGIGKVVGRLLAASGQQHDKHHNRRGEDASHGGLPSVAVEVH